MNLKIYIYNLIECMEIASIRKDTTSSGSNFRNMYFNSVKDKNLGQILALIKKTLQIINRLNIYS